MTRGTGIIIFGRVYIPFEEARLKDGTESISVMKVNDTLYPGPQGQVILRG